MTTHPRPARPADNRPASKPTRPRYRTRTEAVDAAAYWMARANDLLAERTPRESAEAAYKPGGPSVDELETLIRQRYGFDRVG